MEKPYCNMCGKKAFIETMKGNKQTNANGIYLFILFFYLSLYLFYFMILFK